MRKDLGIFAQFFEVASVTNLFSRLYIELQKDIRLNFVSQWQVLRPISFARLLFEIGEALSVCPL